VPPARPWTALMASTRPGRTSIRNRHANRAEMRAFEGICAVDGLLMNI
jgi:hypothetical protein